MGLTGESMTVVHLVRINKQEASLAASLEKCLKQVPCAVC